MSERPIIFSGPMVRAILDETKTGEVVSRTAADMLAAVERAKHRLLRVISDEHLADPRGWLPASIRADRELLKRIANATASLPDLFLWRALPPEQQGVIVAALKLEGVDITDLEPDHAPR